MNFGESISTCMGKYATFSGRASRSEYWWFYLFVVLMSWGASIAGAATSLEGGAELLSGSVNLALVLPVFAAGSRRLRDTGRSGWWQLIMITLIGLIPLIIWWASEGDKDANKYDFPANADVV